MEGGRPSEGLSAGILLDDWRIAKGGNSCCRCGRNFADGQVLFSSLVEQDDEFVRNDFCSDCWAQDGADDCFCFWQSRRARAREEQVVNTELIVEFFDRLEQPDTEQKKAFRFVLALYLMRRKEFKLVGFERSPGRETLSFARRSSGDNVQVENPGLTEDQIEAAAARLGRLLNVGL